MRNRTIVGIILLIIGGIMMIISSTLGSIGVYEFIYSYATSAIPSDFDWLRPVLYVLLEILRWIANLGGGAVIIGALIVSLGSYKFGRWLVNIGLAFGTLTLIIWIITQVVPISNFITDPTILSYLDRIADLVEVHTLFEISGVTIAIIGRLLVKKPKKVKEEIEVEEKIEAGTPLPFQNINCPNCGTTLPFNAEICTECGHTIEKD
ncbi:MAG: hypothetical protein ACFFCV_12710 [Promethearchaeota archaeon]